MSFIQPQVNESDSSSSVNERIESHLTNAMLLLQHQSNVEVSSVISDEYLSLYTTISKVRHRLGLVNSHVEKRKLDR